jgi:hypothetical protein
MQHPVALLLGISGEEANHRPPVAGHRTNLNAKSY